MPWSEQLQSLADSIAQAFAIPANIFSGLISKESSWNVNATGSQGEIGLTQLLPSTAAHYGAVNAWDPTENLSIGAQHLASLYGQYHDWTAALSAYNTGSPNSQVGLAYAADVLGRAGVTGSSAPGPQGVPSQDPSNPGAASYTPSSSSSSPGLWVYGVAIGFVLILLLFGVWALVKGS